MHYTLIVVIVVINRNMLLGIFTVFYTVLLLFQILMDSKRQRRDLDCGVVVVLGVTG